MPPDHTGGACDACLARSWLLAALAPNLERARARLPALLALEPGELIEAVGGRAAAAVAARHAEFDAAAARARLDGAGVASLCRCAPRYPRSLAARADAPAVLYARGEVEPEWSLLDAPAVAIVGARRASPYGRGVAGDLARELCSGGLAVISGLALGVDGAAHAGALAAGGPTLAVLPAGAERCYPRANAGLLRRIRTGGLAISELPPGTAVWRWALVARNRIIAALAAMTVVVEAGHGSGALHTAAWARSYGRCVGAVPGRVTSPLAEGANELLAAGATVVRCARDVTQALGWHTGVRAPATPRRPAPGPARVLHDAVAGGAAPESAIAAAGLTPAQGLSLLAELELEGYLVRGSGGAYASKLSAR